MHEFLAYEKCKTRFETAVAFRGPSLLVAARGTRKERGACITAQTSLKSDVWPTTKAEHIYLQSFNANASSQTDISEHDMLYQTAVLVYISTSPKLSRDLFISGLLTRL